MVFKFLPSALLAAAASVSIANAQSRPPAELPPPGFAGQQYVDSRGCLYIRAGHGGQVNWVARIDRSRRAVCGQTPSTARMAAANRELAAPAPEPVVAAAPAARAAQPAGRVAEAQYAPPPVQYGRPSPLQPRPVAPPVAQAPQPQAVQPQQLAQGYGGGNDGYLHGWYRQVPPQYDNNLNPNTTPARRGVTTPTIGGHPPLLRREHGCPADAPIGRIYPLSDGRNIMLCSNQPHTLRNISQEQAQQRYAPVLAQGGGYVGGARQGGAIVPNLSMVRGDEYVPVTDLMTPPPGYRAAWQDDRLNPNRARGTQAGQQQMAQVWTNEVPQNLTHPAYAQPRRVAVSSKNAPVPQAVAGARFVQVGSFGVPENASRAAARLQAMGLPVQITRSQIRGKPVQVVRAGPFGDPTQAQAALGAARGAGFGDAILRR